MKYYYFLKKQERVIDSFEKVVCFFLKLITKKAIHERICELPFAFVGMTGLEPATSRPPDVYSTGLSYIPFFDFLVLQIYKFSCKKTNFQSCLYFFMQKNKRFLNIK